MTLLRARPPHGDRGVSLPGPTPSSHRATPVTATGQPSAAAELQWTGSTRIPGGPT